MEQGLLKEILDVVVDIKTDQKEMKETLNRLETEQIVIKEKVDDIQNEQSLMKFKLNILMDEQRDTKSIAGAVVKELGNLSKRITMTSNGKLYLMK